jgi:hypothetical protein
VDLNRIKGKQSLSQLHLPPRFEEKRLAHSTGGCVLFDALDEAARLLCFVAALAVLGGCERDESSVIDSAGTPPILLQLSLSPSTVNTDSINIGSSRKPEDVLPISVSVTAQLDPATMSRIAAVRYALTNSDGTASIASGELLDNGQGVDVSKGDGFYSGTVTFQIKRVEVGAYRILVDAEADNGFESNTIVAPLFVYRGNRPPTLSILQAADTVRLGNQSQQLTLRVSADDPDGLADIIRVILNSSKPDGSPSSGNPFQLFDDGSAADHGDERAGDGIYSLIVTLPPATQTGTYRFEFQAFDRSNEGSNIVIHRITIKQ